MEGELFNSWVDQFLKWLPQYKKEIGVAADEKALLYSDNHSSRFKFPESIQKLKAAGVTVVFFPPHTTNVLQPLDDSVFNAELAVQAAIFAEVFYGLPIGLSDNQTKGYTSLVVP